MDRTWRDAVELGFWSSIDCGSREIGARYLKCLEKFGFFPQKFGEEDPPKHEFNSSSPDRILEMWAQHPGQLIIENLGVPGFQTLIHLDTRTGIVPTYLVFAADEKSLESREDLRNFLSFAEELYGLFKPFYGRICHSKDQHDKTVIRSPITIGGRDSYEERHVSANPMRGLPGIYWANFLGPAYVNFFTREVLESAPSYHKQELLDGGYLILTSESPLDYAKLETKKLEEAFTRHVGEEAVFDKKNPQRVLRSPFQLKEKKPPLQTDPRHGSSGNLRSCPYCGETVRIVATSEDHLNHMLGFRCLNCSEVWTVHASLLK